MRSVALTAPQVKDLSQKPYVARELMLIKVRCSADRRRELSDLANIFHGNVCDVSLNTITLEIQGKEDKMHALQGLLEPYGMPQYQFALGPAPRVVMRSATRRPEISLHDILALLGPSQPFYDS